MFKRSVSYRPIPPRNWLGRDLECDSRCGRVATYAQFECLVNSGRGIRARHFLSTRIEKLKQFRPTFLRILDLCLHRKLKERDIEIYFAPNRRVSSLSRRGSRFNQIVQLVARCNISATVCSRSNELNGVNRFRDLISSINLSLFFFFSAYLFSEKPARSDNFEGYAPRIFSATARIDESTFSLFLRKAWNRVSNHRARDSTEYNRQPCTKYAYLPVSTILELTIRARLVES